LLTRLITTLHINTRIVLIRGGFCSVGF